MIALADRVAALSIVRVPLALASRLVGAIDRLLAGRTVWPLAVAVVIALQLLLIFGHRPWLDEWQALMLAIQSPTLPDLFENLRYEGHPPLWYLLLRGAGWVAGPLLALPVTAAVLAVASQLVIAVACPFSRAERLLLGTGCFVLFEFLTISRSLTLGVGMLLVATALWRSRWAWLAIALLPMCDFLFGALSLVLLALRWREGRLWWPGIALWLAVALLSAWSVVPAPDMVPALEHQGFARDLANYLARIGLLLLPLQWGADGPVWNGALPFGLGGPFGILFFLFASAQLRGDRVAQGLFLAFVGLTLAFSLLVYPLPSRHLMLIALLLILLAWRRAAQGNPLSAGFRAWLLVGSACGLFVAGVNLVVPFDTADVAAREIARRGLTDKHWMVFPESRALGVSALTGIAFERTEQRCRQSFVRWNFRSNLQTAADLSAYLRTESATRGRFYLLSDIPLASMLPSDVLLPIAIIPAGYDGFGYHLFVVGAGPADSRSEPPLCVPEQRALLATDR